MRVLFLGSGTSFGVPAIGCGCRACSSADPRDQRYRASVLVEGESGDRATALVIDSGPEFRLQCLRARITRLDALLVTHAHADHIAGLDDVRPFTRERELPVYGNDPTLAEIRERFGYIFRETQKGGGKPRIDLRAVGESAFDAGGLEVRPIPLFHGILPILGYRIGSFAYITDCSYLPESSLPLLEGVSTLVVNGLRRAPHETHFSIDQAIGAARRVGAKRTFLTHMNHESTHAELEEYCAAHGADVGAHPAYDGLELLI